MLNWKWNIGNDNKQPNIPNAYLHSVKCEFKSVNLSIHFNIKLVSGHFLNGNKPKLI